MPLRRPAVGALLVVGAIVAGAVLASGGSASKPRTGSVPTESWQGLVGSPRGDVALGQRMIVVMRAPSLALQVQRAGGTATEEQERHWTAQALSAQQDVLLKLDTKGIFIKPELRFTRTLNGFSAALDPSAVPVLERMPQVAGVFRVRTGTTPGGIPYYIATDPKVTAASRAVLDKVPAMTDYFVGLFGPYPFGSTGAVVDHAPKVGYALETQTKPLYDSPPDELTVSHELAHMWFGDSVTLTRWRDIWVNEGFAEFSAWMWSEHTGQKTAQAYFNRYYAKKADSWVFNPPPANPGGPADMFDGSVYERGAMTLQALRVKLGDGTFFPMLRAWYAAHTYGNVTVPEFTAFASSYAGRDLSAFFQTWLYDEGKPTTW